LKLCSPRPGEVAPIDHGGLGQEDFGLGVVSYEVHEAADQRCPEQIGQLLAVNASLSLEANDRITPGLSTFVSATPDSNKTG
jgi:hypothetical protein